VRSPTLASRLDSLVRPLCEASKLYPSDQDSMSCRSCGAHVQEAMLETLRSISTLPGALGSHACECGHPEMRRLPDGVFHCPACGSEVLPIGAASAPLRSDEHGAAYRAGWTAASGREAASWTAPTWRSGKLHRTGLLTTGAIVQAAKLARAGIVETRTPEKSSSDDEVRGGPMYAIRERRVAMKDR
jgi:hypothetical protein